MTGPRPSAEFPAVDPARDLPAAVELIRRIAAEQHPYDAVLLGMAADVLETVEVEATYAIEGRDETCESCQATVGTSLAYVLDEHTSSIEDGPGSENPPTLCGGSEAAVHYVLAMTPPTQEAGGERKFLTELIDTLDGAGCVFWACQGPDEPYEDMVTCRVCAAVQSARARLAATPSAQGEAEAFAFLDGMYAIREDDVDPDYAARKWAQRGHIAPDEEDRAIVARMLARSAPAPTSSSPDEDAPDAVRADFAAVGGVLRAQAASGEPIALTPCRRCSHLFPQHLPRAAGCIAKGCTCPDYVVTSRTEDEASAGLPS